MQGIQDWIRFYQDKRMWVIPFDHPGYDLPFLKKLKSEDDYKEEAKSYKWDETRGLKLLVGKKGIRVLVFNNLFDKDIKYKEWLLETVLPMLGLPIDYSWIVERETSLSIIMDASNISPRTKGLQEEFFKGGMLIWQGTFAIPSTGCYSYFYRNRIPHDRPISIQDTVILDCYEKLESLLNPKKEEVPQITEVVEPQESSTTTIEVPEEEKKEGFWLTARAILVQVVMLLLLFMLIGLLPSPARVWGAIILVAIWLSWNKFFKKKKK